MATGWDSDYTYEPAPLFENTYQCLPFSKYTNPDLQTGDKIILPQSALARIIQLRIRHPFLFKLEGFHSDKISHCGVLQFDAEEGFVHVPYWMMKNLSLRPGAQVILRDATLSRGAYMKLQPHKTAFIELENPKEVLERGLVGFTCLSLGDTFMIKHEGRDFYFDVLKVYPGEAIHLIDTDCLLDLAPPLDYKEPPKKKIVEKVIEKEEEEEKEEGKILRPFSGRARRLDGKAVAEEEEEKDECKIEEEKEMFKPFSGRSRVLGGGGLFS